MKQSGWKRTPRRERGYGPEWDRVRALVLKRDLYLCQCTHCKAEGRTSAATEVDHVVSRAKAKQLGWSKQKTEHPSNLQAINADCHKRKTIEERGGELKKKNRIGLDGWPVIEPGGG